MPQAFSSCVYCMLLHFQSNYVGFGQPMTKLENETACSKRTVKTRVATRLKRTERHSDQVYARLLDKDFFISQNDLA